MGTEHLILDPVLDYCDEIGVDTYIFPWVIDRGETHLLDALREAHGKRNLREQNRLYQRAKERLDNLANRFTTKDPSVNKQEVDDLRGRFKALDLNLPPIAQKDPIPENEDLEIMLKSSKLPAENTFVISRDRHFLAYKDQLKEWYDLAVVDGRELPFIANRWR